MTIYDQDYIAELDLQNQPGVNTSAAESVEETSQPEAIQEQPVVQAQEDAHESEKEYNFKALREEISREKAERERERQRYSEEIAFLREQYKSKSTNEDQISKSEIDKLSDDDLLTAGQYKRHLQDLESRYQQQLEQVRLNAEEARMKATNPDYAEVMEKYTIPLLQNNRDFARAFQAAENKADFAYRLGKMQMLSEAKPVQEPVKTEQMQKAERIIENSKKPGTLSNARGGQPSLSKAEYYAAMSEAEFNALVSKNLEEV